MKKFKRYVLMIPLLIVMLLNCVCYGQVVYAADSIDYSYLFLDPADKIPHILAKGAFNSVDFSSKFSMDNVFDNYYYQVVSDITETDQYLNGEIEYLNFTIIYVDLTDVDIVTNGSSYTSSSGFKSFIASYKYNKTYAAGWIFEHRGTIDASSNRQFFYFTPANGFFEHKSAVASTGNKPYELSDIVTDPTFYTWYLDTNALDLDGSKLDVSVSFNPELSGAFSRTVLQNGQKVTLDTLNFTVTNNSTFPIQYMVAIVNRDEDFFVYNDNNSYSAPNGKVFGGNPSYVYVKDEWLYLPSGETKKNVTSTFAPSSWHYVSSKNSDSVTIGFNQMKLNIGVYYDVYVYAIRNDSNQVLCIPYNRDSWQYNEDYVIDFTSAELVYSSEFTISNPAIFDPTANDGSYAFDIDDRQLFNRANGYIDENGNVVIDRIDTDSLIGSSDSWGSQYDSDAWETYYTKQNTVSSDIDQLSNNFSSFFKFVNKIFSYFPKNYQNIIMLGITSVVVLAVIKVVF